MRPQQGDELIHRFSHEKCLVTRVDDHGFTILYPSGEITHYQPRDIGYFRVPGPKPEPRFDPFDQPDPLASHPAVRNHGKGVSSEDLASFVEALGSLSQSRIKGTGHEQYGQGQLQKFEEMSPDEMVTGLMEEAADAVNYIAMALIKFLNASAAAKAAAR